MSDHPKKPFNFLAAPEPEVIRDKDNTAPRYEPKLAKKKSAPNLAPGGFLGIRHGLPSNENAKANKRFSLDKQGDVAKEFKFVGRQASSKDRERGR